ncbi:MAG: efflux RND transporter periplasmic adaptor subunit [Acidobacteria bacterium]|nr:efflux RND transporter periplasmic adaptor subunit [Acidobacteriota bacterium]
MSRTRLIAFPALAAMLLVFVAAHYRPTARASTARRVLYYVDPMHPDYKSSKPGIAPDCGMKLVPVYAAALGAEPDDAASRANESSAHAGVQLSADAQQALGIRMARVEKTSGPQDVRLLGRVVPDETRVYRVNSGAEGFVKDTREDAVGNHVSKDQRLATLYSPEFLTIAGGYLSASERTQQSAALKESSPAGTAGVAGVQNWADRLRTLGMSDFQIREITNNRKVPEDIYVVSPADGFILARSISPGLRFDRFTEFYKIADLSHVWVVADMFGREAQLIRRGSLARVTLPDTGQSFTARVSDSLPEVDPATRSLKLRLEVDNPGFALRPDMFVNVQLPLAMPAGLTVPADAVIDSGAAGRVYVKGPNGVEPREIMTGWRMGDRVQVLSGLREGEEVVSSGTFLVDSEARLHPGSRPAAPRSTSATRQLAMKNAEAKGPKTMSEHAHDMPGMSHMDGSDTDSARRSSQGAPTAGHMDHHKMPGGAQ